MSGRLELIYSREGCSQYEVKTVADEGKGVIVLLAQQEQQEDLIYSSDIVLGKQTLPNISRGDSEMNLSVGLGSQLLRAAGIGKMRLLSSPVKYNAISGFDLEVVEYITFED